MCDSVAYCTVDHTWVVIEWSATRLSTLVGPIVHRWVDGTVVDLRVQYEFSI